MQELLIDPVIAADGYTYERRALQDWLKQHTNSPVTGHPLSSTTVMPNLASMKLVENSNS